MRKCIEIIIVLVFKNLFNIILFNRIQPTEHILKFTTHCPSLPGANMGPLSSMNFFIGYLISPNVFFRQQTK